MKETSEELRMRRLNEEVISKFKDAFNKSCLPFVKAKGDTHFNTDFFINYENAFICSDLYNSSQGFLCDIVLSKDNYAPFMVLITSRPEYSAKIYDTKGALFEIYNKLQVEELNKNKIRKAIGALVDASKGLDYILEVDHAG